MSSTATPGNREFTFSERDFRRVCSLIYEKAGIALADSKRDMVYSRLSRRLRALGMSTFQEYLDRLERDGGDEWQAFTNALTTNLTSFFREAHHFEILLKHLRERAGHGELRIWCSAASTGEEPWSLAITACEAFNTLTPPVEILATDIDTQVLATGEHGVYPVERINGLSAERKRKFFQRGSGPHEGMCRVAPALRHLVTFEQLNLLAPSYGLKGPYDAIFCRNVMIYFDKPTQRQVLERMTPLLAADGLLFAGHSESFLHASDLVKPCGRTVYCRAEGTR
jgi:chemotaxis protein methyltransferase CheR